MNNSTFFQCYCKSRELQASFTKCLVENELTPEEEKLLTDAIIEQLSISNRLKNHICNFD
ncbi:MULTISPECIES: hypothetical protein [Virgibacillus]|uniref:Uncharacterized protein n=1 Tax=Virgibacillus pantothenticus TaxID=1473 RepID=A0A0L0QLH7_VIRPA|nr:MULTISPECIES: hypothetical protein [Virgibacillus]API93076.1 hypothetical protein BKP57_15440 [Virgibacillus sp. 6R]KNE19374.1 hypothetical protein AFK71_12785 [Virgibacillus pantothenticus]MBS7429374.1 hypothetical protein [Virgibacillus sp. 19R1-5]MED3737812.1 hypothetical protein [Virgibacillus pantothenticus]QTY15113.1 hypothetical protein KBP50_14485 [Virgibacillus pantothenticus]